MKSRLILALLTVMVAGQAVCAYSPFGGGGIGARKSLPFAIPAGAKRRTAQGAPGAMPYPYVRTSRTGRGIFVSTGNPYARCRVGYASLQRLSDCHYAVKQNGVELKYWQAPSGFCYPWVHGQTFYPYNPSAISINQGSAVNAAPPVTTIINDMSHFIADAHGNGKLTDDEYLGLTRRLVDLEGMWKSVQLRREGMVDSKDEADMNRRLTQLAVEISVRLGA